MSLWETPNEGQKHAKQCARFKADVKKNYQQIPKTIPDVLSVFRFRIYFESVKTTSSGMIMTAARKINPHISIDLQDID